MKINKKIFVAMISAVMMMTSLTGCATFKNFKAGFIEKPQEQSSIRIGVYEPMTGADSESAEQEIKGIELANEMYPTVNGKVVELVYADNTSDIYAAETAIKELLVKEPLVFSEVTEAFILWWQEILSETLKCLL